MELAEIPKLHRLHEQLMDYWYRVANGRAMPLESDINPDDLLGIWQNCFLVRVGDGNFAYDYLGDALVEAYGENLTSREICESLIYPHPEPLFRTFQEVTVSAQPVYVDDAFTNKNGLLIKYRSCVLPLAKAGEQGVAFLLGGMRWKAE
ncbi:MAG: PAS domain-containing protein [Rickettsiales bacterium]